MPEEGTAAAAPEGGAASPASTGGSSTSPAGQTFTQDQVDKLIGKRIAEATAKFSDYDDLKARAAKADELEANQQSETDKLRTKAEREAEKRAASEKTASEATERAQNALKRAAVVSAASQLNAADPEDVFTLLDKSTLAIDDDWNVTGASEAVEALLKSKPHLVKRTATGFGGGQQGGSITQPPSMNDQIRQAAGISVR